MTRALCILDCDDVESFVDRFQDEENTLWVFQHVPKTGGTSIWNMVRQHLKPNRNVFITSDLRQRKEMSLETMMDLSFARFMAAHKHNPFRFVSGHLEQSHIDQILQLPRIQLFTMLREPFSRVHSNYRYQQSPVNPDYVQFRAEYPTFENFYEHPGHQNRMTHRLGGPEANADLAKALLIERYAFCGVLELFDLCCPIISQMLGIGVLSRERFNAGPSIVPNEVVDLEPHREAVLALNADDQELYSFVIARLMERREQILRLSTTERTTLIAQRKQSKAADAMNRAEGRLRRATVGLLRHEGGLDAEWYLGRYTDIAVGNADPYEHYWEHGWREGRDPGPHFSTDWYLKANPDVRDREINPLAHYMAIGRAEGRRAASPAVLREEGGLDVKWYLRRYPDLVEQRVDPYEHYWKHGWREGRDPGPHFSTNWYLKVNADVAELGINPLAHYLIFGRDEGREPFRFATLRASVERGEISPWHAFFEEQVFFPKK